MNPPVTGGFAPPVLVCEEDMTNKTKQPRYLMVQAPGNSPKRPRFLLVKRSIGDTTHAVVAQFYSEGSCRLAVEALNSQTEGQSHV